MTTESPSPSPASHPGAGRIVVLLDGSPLSRSALVAAADIAHARGADVLGVFVEETNLLRSAGYGFACEVGASSGQIRPLNTAQLEARLHTLARQAGRALEQAMAARGIRQTLKRCRGQVTREVLGVSGPDDLLILGRAGWSAVPGQKLGDTARSLIRHAPSDVLLWYEARQLAAGRVVILINHNQVSNHRALDVGAELATRYHQPLTVLVRTDNNQRDAAMDELLPYLQGKGLSARIRLLTTDSPEAAIRVLREEQASHLVVSRGCRLFTEANPDSLLGALPLPVTVTR